MTFVKMALSVVLGLAMLGCEKDCLNTCEDNYDECLSPLAAEDLSDFSWETTCDSPELTSDVAVYYCNCTVNYRDCKNEC